MRICGFKFKRFREWLDVIEEEGREAPWSDRIAMVLKILWTGLRGIFIRNRRWRHKMRVCYKCPIYDRTMRRCRPWTGSPLGCGCFVPWLAMAEKRCWGDEHLPGRIGWHKDDPPSTT